MSNILQTPWRMMCGGLLLSLGLGLLGIAGGARAADLTFNRAYQGTFSGQTFTTTTLLNADPGSIRFSDGGTQRAFQNTSGTLYYSIGGVQYAEAGELNSRFPNGNTLMDAVEFTKSNGPARLLVLGGTYTTSTAYSGSSNAIVAKLNEYVDATAPDPAQTTLLVNGSSSATVAIGSSATIVVTVKLTSGAAVSGATVSLQASPTGTSTYSPSSASTNSSGQATFTVQGTASGAVTYKAVASSGGTSGVSTNSVTVTFVGTRNAQQSTATVPAGVAGSATTITVTVKDSGGGLVTGAAGGLAATIGGTNTGIVPGAISEQGSGLYTFSYVPTTAGTDSIAITLDGSAISGSPYSSVVSAPPMTITTTSLPTPVIGVAYNQTVAISGGTAPVTFAVTTGALPAGLSLNAATGAITGTPTTAGAYSFTITATDANSLTDDQSYSGTISAGVTITTTSLPTPLIGVAYNQSVATSGGTAPVTFAVTTGTLPAGLSLNAATGAITGTPTTAGAYSFTITATDANSLTDDQSYSGTIGAGVTITTTSLPTPVIGVAYNQTVATSGGTAPVTFAVTTGALPAGLSLNAATGAITGTPTTAGAYSFTITATDANSLTDDQSYSGTISAGVTITTTSLPTPLIGVAYNQSVATSGGTAPVTFAVTTGALPAGLSLNAATGAITGTPTTAGAYSFTITATDANSLTDDQSYSGTISAGVTITTTSLPTPLIGVAYNQSVATSGGTAPVTFAVTTGALPTGLSLNAATGAITGTPTTAGAYSFTITATDANSLTDDQSYSGTIGAGVTITTTSLPTPVIGVAYNQTVATSGGTAPVTFAVTTGALPAGLSLNAATGAITGTPTTAGAHSFTITATDANSLTDDQSYSGTIAAPPPEAVEISADVAATEIESGTSVSFDLASLVKGAFEDIRIVAPPSHGRLVLEGGNQARSSGGAQRIGVASASASPAASSARVVTYQPNPGYTGPDSFQFVATGPGGDSNVATVSINVRGEAPAARSFSATAIDGQTLSFDLTAGLTGPFSRAVIDQVAPAAAADARIVETSADGARGYRLDMAMAQGFGGTVVVTYRLGNAVGLSAPATVTVVVTPRPDPSADPSIRAISEAQAQATQRFSRAQVDNFMRRAESLHGVPCAAASMGVRLNVPISSDQPPGEGLPGRPQDGSGASSAKSVNGGASPSNDDHEQRGCDEVKVSMWVGGALDVGRRDERRDRAGLKITSQGLSMGADAEIAPGLRMGLGLGLGKDRVSANGDADVDGDSWSMAAYGSFMPGGSLFIDGVVAQGWVDFDTRRLADNAMRAVGEREGRFSTAALAVGVEHISGAMQWSVYGRAQTLYSRLDSYTEQGAELYNLRFDARRLRSVSSVLGFRAGSSQVLPIGVLMSGIRAEWRHEFAEGGNEGLDYADRAGPSLYHFDTAGWLSDEFLVSPTLDLTLPTDWRIALEAGLRGGGGEWILSPRLQIRRAF